MVEDENKTSGMEKKVGDNESESGSSKDSVSSQGDLVVTADQKKPTNKHGDGYIGKSTLVSGSKTDRKKSTPSDDLKFVKTVPKSNRRSSTPSSKRYSGKDVDKNNDVSKTPFKSSGVEDSPFNNVKEISKMDQISSGTRSICSDEEAAGTVAAAEIEGNKNSDLLIQEMESKIEKLEEELREVAALEISIYSIVPEHGSSAHKVHTPARRLSRLYIHACKHRNQETRATVARSTISGLVLVSKSCGNDVTRLTFWLSNIVVLREIICETFGASCHSSPATKFSEINRNSKKNAFYGNLNKPVFSSLQTEWQETGTFIYALKSVESWIFSRLVESVWWQALAPNMQSGTKGHNKCNTRVPGPSLGDQQQGNFSINLWQNAFEEAFQRLCPVRAGGHECGCLPVLAKMVMEQCVARLDVAMFNAILRESVHEIPTDPISDPIVDPKVLPIPAGELSFGSGAQLKNSIGTWSRWLTSLSNVDVRENSGSQQQNSDDDSRSDSKDSIAFPLLNSLSDLLMLPKDMLMDRSMRKEVCPLINLSLIKRILCNFTPDEFCLDPIPGSVLESLNSESIVERRLSGDFSSSFPYKAGAVVYSPPKTYAVAYKVAEVGTRTQLMRNASLVQKKGYTSDDELQELSSPLESIFDELHISLLDVQKSKYHGGFCSETNTRYELLSEVWRT